MSTNTAEFSFVVKACPDMNALRVTMGIEAYPCAEEADIVAAQASFSVLVGMVHETFDNWEYNQDGGLQS